MVVEPVVRHRRGQAEPPPESQADQPVAPPRDRSERLFPVGAGRLGTEGLVAAVITWVWAALSYRVWKLSPRVPINPENDGRLITTLIRTTADEGWWTTNPNIGVPGGQQLYDFPHNGETWQFLIIRGMSLFTKSPGLLMNAYFFLGMGLIALASYLALRHLRFGVGLSLVASTALAWLPFRLGHKEYHLFRVGYWWVPLAVVMVLWVLHWRERFLIDPEPASPPGWRAAVAWNVRHNLRRRRLVVFGAMVVLLAGSETMTTAFTLTLLALTGIIGAVRRREPATLVVHGLAIVAIGMVLALLFIPTLRFVAAQGPNEEAGRRKVIEQEKYGLKISSMLLPDPGHRWELLRGPARQIRENSDVPSEGGQSIGLLGAAGFLGAVGHSLTRGWGARRRERRPPSHRDGLKDDLGLVILLGTLVATISGGAILMSVAGFSQVRVWNRMVLIIGFASIIFALTWLETGWAALRARITGAGAERTQLVRAVGVGLVVLLVGFALWDGAWISRTSYEEGDAAWAADEAWVDRIDEATPDGTAVFQLPVVPFPEQPPPGKMFDYDHLRAYVHTDDDHLRWSYGAIKGRPDGDWQRIVRDELGAVDSLPALIGAGFTGLWVDTFGYDDGGVQVRIELDEATGVEPMVSADGRTLYYDLRPLRDRYVADGVSMSDLRALAREQLRLDLSG